MDLALLCVGALLYRIVFLWAMPRVLDTADAIHYIETARHLAAGDFWGYDPKIPVLYPLLGAFLSLFIQDMEWACRMVSFVASVLLIVPVYMLARDIYDRRTACFSAIVVMFWPWLADYGCRVATEATAMSFWFFGAWLLARAVRRGGAWIWIAPWPFLALYLTRAEGMFLLLAAPAIAALLLAEGNYRQAISRLLPYLILGAVVLVANSVYVRSLTGEATVNYRIGFIVREFDVLRFAKTVLTTVTEVLPIMLGPVLLLFLGAGLFGGEARPQTRRMEGYLLLLAAVQWGTSLFVLSPAPRYLMAPLIVLSIIAAHGMARVNKHLRNKPHGTVLAALPLTALLLFMSVHTAATVGAEYVGRRPREPREYKAAGLWMKENLPSGLIFSRKPQIGFYADMPSTGPALEDSLGAAVQRAHRAGAAYFVVDERYTVQDVPALRPLLDPENAPETLQFLTAFDLYPQARVVLYALRPGGQE